MESSTNCINCAISYSRNIGSTSCTLACGTGYYPEPMTDQCTICPIGCAVCTTSSSCSQCHNVSGLLYFLLNNACSITCPSGTYGGVDNSNNPICTNCLSPCLTCNGSTSCLSCVGGYNLVYGTTICNSTCPIGQFANSSVCLLCTINCVTCDTSAGKCDSCGPSVYGVNLYLSSSSCITVCPVHFFANTITYNCDPCDASCYTCSGSSPNKCTSCNSGSLENSNSSCISSCLSGEYSLNNLCVACPVQCSTCQSAIHCTSCQSVNGVNYYLTSSYVCAVNCPSSTFANVNNNNCDPCDSSCQTCVQSATKCLTCNSNNYYIGTLYSCSSSGCPAGQYYANNSYICARCNSNCAQCSYTSTTCTLCTFSSSGLALYLFSDSKCYATCPFGYYGYNSNCVLCDSSCSGCSIQATNCLQCASTYFRVIGSDSCTQQCGSGYYSDNNTNLCTVCPIGCSLCSIVSNILTCSQCKNVSGVTYYYTNNTCSVVCPIFTYGGVDNNSNLYC